MCFGIFSVFRYIICKKAPHKTVKRFSRTGLCFNLHPTRQPEYDPVLTVHGHAFHQPGPQALIELGDELRNVEFPVRIELIYHSDKRGLDLILRQVRCLAAGFVFELVIALPDHAAVLVVAAPDLRAVPSAAAPAPDLSGEYGHPTVYWKKSLDSASSIYYN